MPVVSIIVPAYQAEGWLHDCINSVLNQTFTNWELIVVNDGSTDATGAIVIHYEQQDKRIRHLFQENGRQAKARNTGIKASSGAYIAFLDADDLWTPDKLQQSLELLHESGCDMVCTNAWEWDGESPLSACRTKSTEDAIYSGKNAELLFTTGNRIALLTAVVKRDALLSVGAFDEDLLLSSAEDYDLWIRLIKAGYKIRSVSDCTAIYRLHASSATHGDHIATIPAARVILKNFSPDDFSKSEWVQIRRKWVQRLVSRLQKSGNKAEITSLVRSFLPEYRYLVTVLLLGPWGKYPLIARILDKLARRMKK